jgi:hypothetical protein
MKSKTIQKEARQAKALTNFWLITLSTIVGLTVLCCATLVGWPIVAHLADKIVG